MTDILGEKLGEGTFSVVRQAEDITTNKKWAVKVIEIAKVEGENASHLSCQLAFSLT